MRQACFIRLLGPALIALFVTICVHAGGYAASEHIQITDPWSRALPAVSTNGAAYFTAMNKGEKDGTVVGASSPIAERTELHTHTMEGGIARMSRIEGGIVVPAGGSATLAPGGMHVMLMRLVEPLQAGKVFPLTLEFEDGGSVEVEITVLSADEAAKMGGSMGHGEMEPNE